MAEVKLWSVRNGLKRFEKHREAAHLARSAAVEYGRRATIETTRVVRLSRYLRREKSEHAFVTPQHRDYRKTNLGWNFAGGATQ